MQDDAWLKAGELTSEIYAALLGTGSWQSFLDNLSGVLPNGKAVLFYHDLAARTGAFSLTAGLDSESVDAYGRYYAALNPWAAKAANRPLDLAVRAEMMLPRADLLRTEFYADFLRPRGLDTGVGVTVFRDHACSFMLSTLCASGDDERIGAATVLLARLAPHLRQAFAYHRRAGSVAGGRVAVDAASDALGVAIMSVGLDRRVRWTNAAGRSLLALGDTLGTDVMGRVTGVHAEVREALDEALAAAVRGEGTGKRTLTLPPVGNAPAVRLSLVVPALRSCEQYFAGPSVVLLVEPAAPAASLPEAALRGTFALTPTEARIACGVAAGARIADVAAAQGMTVATARVHLRNVFAKMNVRRQAELVVKVQSYR